MIDKLINLGIGFAGVVPGVIMAFGFWQSVSELPAIELLIQRAAGAFVVVSVIAFLQPKKDIKKMSQLGIAIGFLWTLTALILKLEW
jgi:hypothetical protein